MKNVKYIYPLWILLIANLFYHEFFGLNVFVMAVLTIPIFLVLKPENRHNKSWWLGAFLFTASATSIFVSGGFFSHLLFVVAGMYFFALQSIGRQSLFFAQLQTLQSWVIGFYHFFNRLFRYIENHEDSTYKKGLMKSFLVLIPLLIAVVFLKLYQAADATFYAYTQWINLDWISWEFIGFYFTLFFLLFGLYYFTNESSITGWDESLGNEIGQNYTDKVQAFFTVKNENSIGLVSLMMLNAMLLLYNFIDIRFVVNQLFNHQFDSSYSQVVHGGINSLITSIILVILLVTFLFRGQLNFVPNKSVKYLAYIWLGQNVCMIFTTAIKNWAYIANWGLTYKRIGVMVYLFLALIGLLLTLYKLLKAKSIWFLTRQTTFSFFTFFIIFSLPNWDGIITKFNLSQLDKERVDFYYLLDLGKEAYPQLIAYEMQNNLENQEILDILKSNANSVKDDLETKKKSTSWRSLNLTEYSVLEAIKGWDKMDYELSNNRYE